MANSMIQGDGMRTLNKEHLRPPFAPVHRVLQSRKCLHRCQLRQHKSIEPSWVVRAAAVGDVDDLEDVDEATVAAVKASPEEAPAKFSLNLLWMENNIGLAVDQVYAPKMRSPLTEYFFWPKVDAWEELKTDLETKPWVSSRDRIILLNLATEVINFWQTEGTKRPTVEEAREQFKSCIFRG